MLGLSALCDQPRDLFGSEPIASVDRGHATNITLTAKGFASSQLWNS
jgi:hypothetical protein